MSVSMWSAVACMWMLHGLLDRRCVWNGALYSSVSPNRALNLFAHVCVTLLHGKPSHQMSRCFSLLYKWCKCKTNPVLPKLHEGSSMLYSVSFLFPAFQIVAASVLHAWRPPFFFFFMEDWRGFSGCGSKLLWCNTTASTQSVCRYPCLSEWIMKAIMLCVYIWEVRF